MPARTQIKLFLLASALVGALSFSLTVFASTGFLENPLWLSPESPKENSQVTLGAVFHNSEASSVSGTVLFYDGNVLLGRKTVNILPGGVATATVTFVIGAGDHSFSASMSSLAVATKSGGSVPLALPISTAKLPNNFVPKNTTLALGAQSSSSSNNPEQPILDKIDSAEKSVVSVIPPSIKDSTTVTAKNIDTWRNAVAKDLATSRASAQKSVDEVKKVADAETKKLGSPSPTTKFVDTPFAYAKLIFFSLVAFIFSNVYAFYFVAFVIFVWVVRRIMGYSRRYLRGKKGSGASAPVAKMKE